METCSICNKPIYGHPTPRRVKKRVNGVTVYENGPVVCGSCPLNKAQGGATGKSFSEVRMDMAKLVIKPILRTEVKMKDLKVKSNVRNRTILLDGRFPVVFGSDGHGRVPGHLRELFEREMAMKPGRFSIVVESSVEPVEEPAPEVFAPMVAEAVVEDPKDVVPQEIDQSFLVSDVEPMKPVKASKKK